LAGPGTKGGKHGGRLTGNPNPPARVFKATTPYRFLTENFTNDK